MLISKKSEKLLRKISKVDFLQSEDVAAEFDSSIESLISRKFIEAEVALYMNAGGCTYTKFWITESGQAYLDGRTNDSIRFWIPTVLSTLALIVSILSVVFSPFLSAYFSYLWGL